MDQLGIFIFSMYFYVLGVSVLFTVGFNLCLITYKKNVCLLDKKCDEKFVKYRQNDLKYCLQSQSIKMQKVN